ncbi:MAG: ABC transporter ATP-binding protein [Candidatus Yanofskybacteria bacterium]|nr:ABC transporter ATP-binding protein [Candidatus Yanofskybacteria bacterium]
MIKVVNVSKNYGEQRAVNNLSLGIEKGSIFGFLGPNGAGKTTTIKMLTGINSPDQGKVEIDGWSPELSSVREKIGFKPEEPHFYEYLTGLEFIKFAGNLFERSYQKKESDYLGVMESAGLYGVRDKIIKHYSKGMRQRLGFAQAIINDPEYIFLDEPLEGLDPIGRRELKNMIERLKSQNKTIFFNSHILSDIEILCDQIGIIHKWKLVYSGSVLDFCRGEDLEKRFIEEIEKIEGSHSVA